MVKKNSSNFIIEGDSFDLARLINNFMDSDDENSSIFQNFNSKIDIKIKKTYIDEANHLKNLSSHQTLQASLIHPIDSLDWLQSNRSVIYCLDFF